MDWAGAVRALPVGVLEPAQAMGWAGAGRAGHGRQKKARRCAARLALACASDDSHVVK